MNKVKIVLISIILILINCAFNPVKAELVLESPRDFSGGWIEEEPGQYLVILNWNANEDYLQEETDIYYSNYGYILYKDGVEVYRLEPSDSGNEDVNFLESYNLNTGGIFFDSETEKGKIYNYSLVSFDHDGNFSDPVQVSVKIFPEDEDICSSDPAIKGTVEDLDASTKVVRLNWAKYCEDNVEYRLYRDGEQILTIKPEELEGYLVGENTIDYVDKDIDQGKKTYKYKVEVWGEKTSLRTDFFLGVANAADEEKKAESETEVSIDDDETTSPTPTPSTTLLNWKPKYLPTVPFETLADKVLAIFFASAIVLLVLMLLYAGIMYITSSGDEAKAEKAKKIIYGCLIGIAISFGSYGLARWIVSILQ
jgi:hypothetical protein